MNQHAERKGVAMNRKRLIGIAVAIVVVVALVAIVILRSREQQPDTITIGAVLPLTGSAAIWGQNAKMGMDLALEEINDSGGIDGCSVVVLYEDSGSDPKSATSALQKLISTKNIQVVIGDIASSSVLAMAPIAERNKVVLLSPGASNPKISESGEFIFRNWQSDALEGEVDARYAYNTLKWRRVACLYVNNAYGSGLATVFSSSFTQLGGNVVAQESFQQGATDIRAQIAKISVSNADGLFMPGYPPEMALALKQMRETGLRLPILSVQAFDDPEILKRAGNAAEGAIFSVPKPPDASDPVVSRFQARYESKYGKKPGVCSDTGYDAVRIIASVIKGGARTGTDIRQGLTQIKDFPGAAGATTFDKNGDVVRDFIFKKVQDGHFVPVTQEDR